MVMACGMHVHSLQLSPLRIPNSLLFQASFGVREKRRERMRVEGVDVKGKGDATRSDFLQKIPAVLVHLADFRFRNFRT